MKKARGEANSNVKLSDDLVRELYRLHEEEGMSYAALDKQFGIGSGGAYYAIIARAPRLMRRPAIEPLEECGTSVYRGC